MPGMRATSCGSSDRTWDGSGGMLQYKEEIAVLKTEKEELETNCHKREAAAMETIQQVRACPARRLSLQRVGEPSER